MEGTTQFNGEVSYRVNPPVIDPASSGIQYLGTQTTIRIAEDGSITINLVGRASYANRTASVSIPLHPTGELVSAITALIAEYGNEIYNKTIAAAAEAMGVANSKGEL